MDILAEKLEHKLIQRAISNIKEVWGLAIVVLPPQVLANPIVLDAYEWQAMSHSHPLSMFLLY